MSNEYETLMRCVRSVRTKTDFVPKVALVLGSGLGDYASQLRVEATVDYHEIEGFRYLRCRAIPGALCLVMSGMCRLCACRDVCIIMKDIP